MITVKVAWSERRVIKSDLRQNYFSETSESRNITF